MRHHKNSMPYYCTMISIVRKTSTSMKLRYQIIGAAAFSSLLLCPYSSNAFAGANSFSRPLNPSSHAAKAETTQLSSFPKAISVSPGEYESVEEQKILNPIDENCTVLIVGSTRGIGIEFVKQCLSKGATVIATYRSDDIPYSLSIYKGIEDLHAVQMDLEDGSSIERVAKDLRSRTDIQPITHIIQNAGIYLPETSFDGSARSNRAVAPKVTKEVMIKTFEINSVAPLLVAQNFVPLLKTRQPQLMPVIAFITSKVASVDDNSSGGSYAYRASKSALNIVAKSLSIDLCDKARVVLLHPGYVRTDMTNRNGLIDADVSVSGMLKAIENTDAKTGFRFVDYKACLIPW